MTSYTMPYLPKLESMAVYKLALSLLKRAAHALYLNQFTPKHEKLNRDSLLDANRTKPSKEGFIRNILSGK